jgi:acyl-CoA thioesterase
LVKMMSAVRDFPEDHDERLHAMLNCQFMEKMDMEVISIDDNEVRLAMNTEGNRNALGSAHGGALFSLADQAFALAANRTGEPEVAISASINYMKPARGRLEAVAKRIEENNTTSVYQVIVYDENKVVAIFQGVGYKLKRKTSMD